MKLSFYKKLFKIKNENFRYTLERLREGDYELVDSKDLIYYLEEYAEEYLGHDIDVDKVEYRIYGKVFKTAEDAANYIIKNGEKDLFYTIDGTCTLICIDRFKNIYN